jgi:hypothetical protein
LGRPHPNLQLASAISSEEQPTSHELDGLHFFLGGKLAPLIKPERKMQCRFYGAAFSVRK